MSLTQDAILRQLAAARGAFVSGEALGGRLGVSRAAIGKAVGELRARGYAIDSLPHHGYRLVARTGLLLPAEIDDGLRTESFGRTVHHYDAVASTQAVARTLADGGAPDGTLVVAETQSAGRGRLSRPYVCPPGGIWCTLIVRPRIPPSLAPLVSLAAGVAVAQAIREIDVDLPVLLKWPNDVLISDRKVAGILTEMVGEEQAVQYLLVGVGINVNFPRDALPPEIRTIATTIQSERGAPIDRRALLQRCLEQLERLCDLIGAGREQDVLAEWRTLPNTIGRAISATTWRGAVEGRATALGDDGALLVERADGTIERLVAADIVHRGPA